MKKYFLLTLVMMLSSQVWGALLSEGEVRAVVLSGTSHQHFAEAAPEAAYLSMGSLSVVLDATHYASYSVSLTAPSGETTTVSATSPTVILPVTGQGDGFVVTVRTADGSTFDGVFSRSGAGTVTLSNHQALQLAKNRRLDSG